MRLDTTIEQNRETQSVVFSVVKSEAGIFDVNLNGLMGYFAVEEVPSPKPPPALPHITATPDVSVTPTATSPEPEITTNPAPSPVKPQDNTGQIVVIIAGCVAVVAGIIFSVRLRRKTIKNK